MGHMPPSSGPVALDLTRSIISVKDYGAKGDGVTDDTAAINTAVTAARATAGANVLGAAVFFPAGKYLVGTTIAPPSYVTFKGDSRYTTTIQWIGAAGVGKRLFDCTDKYGVGFQDLSIQLPVVAAPNTVTAFYLSNSFRFTFQRVIVSGNHTVSTPDPQSTGIEFRNNAGDSRIIDCDINALGAGIRVGSIMNYAVGCVFGNNKYSVYGDEATFGPGMVIESCTFVGTGATGGTQAHIICDQGGNIWRVLGCWFEGSRVGIQIGSASGGPQEFGVIGCKIAAVDTGIDVRACPLPYLANITFSTDTTGTPIGAYNDVLINATDAPNGVAMGVRRSDGFDYAAATFPSGWTVAMRGTALLPPSTIRGATTISGAATLSSTLAVTGTSTLTGDVGMGASPSAGNKCHVQGSACSTGGWYTNSSRTVGMNESAGVLQFRTNNADAQMSLNASAKLLLKGVLSVSNTAATISSGAGTPEGVVTAPVGSLYMRTDGGAATTLYVKESGSGNTGWVAK